MLLQVFCEEINFGCEDRDLDMGRTRVFFVDPVLADELFLDWSSKHCWQCILASPLFSGKCPTHSPSPPPPFFPPQKTLPPPPIRLGGPCRHKAYLCCFSQSRGIFRMPGEILTKLQSHN